MSKKTQQKRSNQQRSEIAGPEWQADRLEKEHGLKKAIALVDEKVYIQHIDNRQRQQYWIQVKLILQDKVESKKTANENTDS